MSAASARRSGMTLANKLSSGAKMIAGEIATVRTRASAPTEIPERQSFVEYLYLHDVYIDYCTREIHLYCKLNFAFLF